jgi:hypothetical protein
VLTEEGDVAARPDAAGRKGGSRARDGSPVLEKGIEESRFVPAGVLDAKNPSEPWGVVRRKWSLLCARGACQRADEQRSRATAPLPARRGTPAGSP